MILPTARAVRWGCALAVLSLGGVAWAPAGWACVGLLLSLLAAVALEGARLPRSAVSWARRVPLRLSIGEPEPLVEELHSLCPFPLRIRVVPSVSGEVAIEPTASPEVVIPPRGTARIAFTLRVARRGEHRIGPSMVRLEAEGALALRQIPVGEATPLRVFPNVARVRRYETLRRARALAALGIHRTRLAGGGGEFDHLRPYVRDDDYRRIHWKATARRGFPVTRIVRTERGQSVLVAVDASHWMGIASGDLSRLDYAVDAALFLAHVAHQAGDQVGLALFASDVVAFLPPSSRPGAVRRILETLYAVRHRAVYPSYRNLARQLMRRRLRRSLVVILTEPPDAEAAGELSRAASLLRPRHFPLVVGLRDPGLEALAREVPRDVPGLCRRVAASEASRERTARLASQRRLGLEVLDVLPRDLSVSLVNRYLSIKARGVL